MMGFFIVGYTRRTSKSIKNKQLIAMITMRTRNTLTTDTGIVIDPDDDAEIIAHKNYYEVRTDTGTIYCNYYTPTND